MDKKCLKCAEVPKIPKIGDANKFLNSLSNKNREPARRESVVVRTVVPTGRQKILNPLGTRA